MEWQVHQSTHRHDASQARVTAYYDYLWLNVRARAHTTTPIPSVTGDNVANIFNHL
jgi:hypothetical protein